MVGLHRAKDKGGLHTQVNVGVVLVELKPLHMSIG